MKIKVIITTIFLIVLLTGCIEAVDIESSIYQYETINYSENSKMKSIASDVLID